MKFVRFGPAGQEKPGILFDGLRRDASSLFRDWDREFFESGGLERLRQLLTADVARFPPVAEGARWAPCVARPSKVVCVVLNYKDHARESGAELPKEPVLFLKAPNAVIGPYDCVTIPRGSTK